MLLRLRSDPNDPYFGLMPLVPTWSFGAKTPLAFHVDGARQHARTRPDREAFP